jgi:hypothetical protein
MAKAVDLREARHYAVQFDSDWISVTVRVYATDVPSAIKEAHDLAGDRIKDLTITTVQ